MMIFTAFYENAAAGWVHWPGPAGLAAWSAALVGAVLLTSAITTLMNITMFWTISARGINTTIGALMFLLGGIMIPLPLFPRAVQPLLRLLPFCGIGDVPFRLFTGDIPPAGLPAALLHQLAWTAALVLIGRLVLARAVRRLVVQGG